MLTTGGLRSKRIALSRSAIFAPYCMARYAWPMILYEEAATEESVIRSETVTITRVGILKSVQVGIAQRYITASATDGMGRSWETSFFRMPSDQPRWLYTTHLEGNIQADTKNHGRLSQAVLL